MNRTCHIKGSIVALLTPFTADGQIDFATFDRLVDFHLCAGTSAILVTSTTGEAPTLSFEEHVALYRAAVVRADGRIPIIAGVDSPSTEIACELSELAGAARVDAVLCTPPRYNGFNGSVFARHFSRGADAGELPMIVCDVPHGAGEELPDGLVRELSEDPRMIGFNEATGDIDRATRLIKSVATGFNIYSGLDWTAFDIIAAGGAGVVSVAANLVPVTMKALCEGAAYGDAREAIALETALIPLYEFLSSNTNPIPAKLLAHEMGLMAADVRSPLCVPPQVSERLTSNGPAADLVRPLPASERFGVRGWFMPNAIRGSASGQMSN